MGVDFRQRIAGIADTSIASFVVQAGYGKGGSIDADMTFREWCEDLGKKGLKIDRKPFRLDNRPSLLPIYDAIPTTREEAAKRILTIQKATQLGLTVWEVLADLYMASKWGPVNIGMFMPDQSTASFKSEQRFMPIVRSATDLYRDLTHRLNDDGTLTRIGEGNIMTRAYRNSLLMFLWTSGKVSTESRPMDVVSLDEVQSMSLEQIDKVRARTGDSDVAFTLLLSTAHLPELDINFWYKLGSQEVWHTKCDCCGALSDLSDPALTFPAKSIVYRDGEYHWCCPVCEETIKDAQNGCYLIQHPEADPKHRSFLLPRTISPRITPREMITDYQRARTGDQKKSFFNRTLARPYIDPQQLPVTLSHCLACVEEGRRAGLVWEKSGRDTTMGIDQMGGWCAVIIKRRLPDGRQAVCHVEAIFDDDPFARCSELMKRYGVAVCVVEQLPNVNDARRFTNRHPGRVFMATSYAVKEMIVWGDDISGNDRKTAVEDRERYSVAANQYKAMQVALYRIRDKFCLFPDPSLLEQEVFEDGVGRRIPIVTDWVFDHFTKTAIVVEQHEEERKPRARVLKIGIDPHYSFANMLCDIAWARNYGTGSFILPDVPASGATTSVQESMPGLPGDVAAMMQPGAPGTCGGCRHNEAGQCGERNFRVMPGDPACMLYSAIEE